jgi:5-methylcytosine-specific restriction protein A
MPWAPKPARPKQRPRDHQPSRNRDNKLYGRKWKEASLRFRQQNPLCAMCQAEGIVTAAHATDHITPHKGNVELFWDTSNWQALCELHHNRKSGKE